MPTCWQCWACSHVGITSASPALPARRSTPRATHRWMQSPWYAACTALSASPHVLGLAPLQHLSPVSLRKVSMVLPSFDVVQWYRGLRGLFSSALADEACRWCDERLMVITQDYEDPTGHTEQLPPADSSSRAQIHGSDPRAWQQLTAPSSSSGFSHNRYARAAVGGVAKVT